MPLSSKRKQHLFYSFNRPEHLLFHGSFSLDVLFHKQIFTIKYSIREFRNPIAQYHHTGRTAQH